MCCHIQRFYIALVGFLAFLSFLREPARRLVIVKHLGITALVTGLLYAPWLWRNWKLYGALTADQIVRLPAQWDSTAEAIRSTTSYLSTTFWAASGLYNNVSWIFPFFGILLACLSIVGLIVGLVRRRGELVHLLGGNETILVALGLTILASLGLAIRFGISFAQGQGRFLYPMLIPVSLFLGAGLWLLPGSKTERAPVHLVGFFSTYAFSFCLFSLAVFAVIGGSPQ